MPLRHILFVTLCTFCAGSRADLVGIDFGAPGNTPANWTSVTASGSYWNLINDEGQATRVGLSVSRAGTPFSVSPLPTSLPSYKSSLGGIDGNQYEFGGTFEAEISGLKPLEPYSIYIFGLRGGAELTQGVALSGGRGLTLTQKAPDSMLVINDQLGSDQRSLSSYAKTLTSSRNGTISLNLTGGSRANQTYAIAGIAIEGDFPGSAGTSVTSTAPQPAEAAGAPAGSASAPATAPVTRSEPTGPDVLGVYLGMPYREAYAVIAGTYPEMPLTPFQWWLAQVQKSRISGGPKYEAGFQGAYNARERNDRIIVMAHMPPNEDRVAGIARYTYTGEMLLSEFRASLVEKYGEPHLEIPAGTVLRKPHRIYSWSLNRNGQPQTDPVPVISCVYQQAGSPWEGGAPVTLWDTEEAFNGIYDDCGLTLAVVTLEPAQQPPRITGFGVVLYDLNEIRRTARQAWEDTDRMATRIEEDKEKTLSGKKPVL
ncbi:MAG: hypothetical protein AB7I04_14655 [Pseudomonadales bacterium]